MSELADEIDSAVEAVQVIVRMGNGDEYLIRSMPKIEADALLAAHLDRVDVLHIVMAYDEATSEDVYLNREHVSSVHVIT